MVNNAAMDMDAGSEPDKADELRSNRGGAHVMTGAREGENDATSRALAGRDSD